MYQTRTIEQTILSVSRSFPCIVIYGPRQVGKSTTMDMLFGKTCTKVTLDDADNRNLALNHPKQFLEMHPWPLIIDEIQKAPNLLDEIKKKIDEQRLQWLKEGEERKLMYILTGSNRFELQQGISDSLAGRCGVLDLLSFSRAEKEQTTGRAFHPSIAELLDREREQNVPYMTRREIKDVKKLIAASSEMQFRNFLELLALRTAHELRYDVLANSVGIDVRTLKKWISILETSGIIYLLHPYLPNQSNRIIKAPKLYFTDTGLCAYLCKWPNAQMLENGVMSGAFFETFVVSELLKNLYAYNREPKDYLFYYRDTDQKEI